MMSSKETASTGPLICQKEERHIFVGASPTHFLCFSGKSP